MAIPMRLIEEFCDTAEFYRKVSAVVDRGVGQPTSAQPDLGGFYFWSWYVSSDRVHEMADSADAIVRDREVSELLGAEAVTEVKGLVAKLHERAPDMIEWEAYEPRGRPSVFGDEYPDWGTGYSAAAARVLNDVARCCVRIMRIFQRQWDYVPLPPDVANWAR